MDFKGVNFGTQALYFLGVVFMKSHYDGLILSNIYYYLIFLFRNQDALFKGKRVGINDPYRSRFEEF